MKTLIGMFVCLAIGAAMHSWLSTTDQPVVEKARKIAADPYEAALQQAGDAYYDACRRRFLDKNNCFQKGKTAKCMQKLEKRCGNPDAPQNNDDDT